MEEKLYIFISHSHKDVEKVRVIRNYLESLGGEPILFFLLSKDDDSEVASLIKDEIAARIWFIYIESESAKESKWVKTELQYAHDYPKSNILTINLDQSFIENTLELKEETKELLAKSLFKMKALKRVFFSYYRKDEEIVSKIINNFKKYHIDFICPDNSYKPSLFDGTLPLNEFKHHQGFFVQLVGDSSYDSSFLVSEMMEAFKNNAVIFLVMLNLKQSQIRKLYENMKQYFDTSHFRRMFFYNFNVNKIDQSCDELINLMYERGFYHNK